MTIASPPSGSARRLPLVSAAAVAAVVLAVAGSAGAAGNGLIAFATTRDGDSEIWVMNAAGGGEKAVTQSSAADADPAWSPDGRRIAFHSERDGNAEIYVMQAD